MATRIVSHHDEPVNDMDRKKGGDHRMVCPQLRMETPIFVCWVFAVYGDGLEVLSLDELILEGDGYQKGLPHLRRQYNRTNFPLLANYPPWKMSPGSAPPVNHKREKALYG